MKKTMTPLIAAALCGFILPSPVLGDEKDHKNEDHHEGHKHHHQVTGPNKGRMIMDVEPHAEFFVTEDRKVRITFVDDEGKMVPATTQKVSIVCGDRTDPTMLKMEAKDGVLLSDKKLPEGKAFPIVVSFKVDPESKTVREKFHLNLNDCATCDFEEYRCTCDHHHAGE